MSEAAAAAELEQEVNPLEMSDEDFLAKEESGGFYETPSDKQPETVADQVDSAAVVEGNEELDNSGYFESGMEAKEPAEETNKEESTDGDTTKSNDDTKGDTEAESKKGDDDVSSATTDDNVTTLSDAEQLKLIYASFKANGAEMQVETPEEVITLMQKGAGFDQKVREIAPQRKILATLKAAGLLEGDTLDLLIDANNKNPDAIAKLVKQAEIDPLYLDTEGKEDYTPTDNSVSDGELDLNAAVDSIRTSPKYEDTMQVLTKEWDEPSQQLVLDNPQVIKAINEHMENGVYEKIDAQVQKNIALGRIPSDTPYLEAYHSTGNEMDKAGEFGTADASTATQDTSDTVKQDAAAQAGDQTNDNKATSSAARNAAATTTSSSAQDSPAAQDNPLEMSDADFLKKYGGAL